MDVYVNDKKVEVAREQHISVNDLLNHINVTTPNAEIQVEVNGEDVPRSSWLKYSVQPGATVRITRQD